MTIYRKRGPRGDTYYSRTDFNAGEVVCYTGSHTSTLTRGARYLILGISYEISSQYEYYEGDYVPLHTQRLRLQYVDQSRGWVDPDRKFHATNFKLVKEASTAMPTIHSLDSRRPHLVREVLQGIPEGKTEVETTYGEIKEFPSLSDAQAWCKAQITDSIRRENTYRKFEIFQCMSVAQARQPEIEFV